MEIEQVLSESFPAVAPSIPRARTRVADYARDRGASQDVLDAIRLASSEALTNVVVHAYPAEPGEVHVSAVVAEGHLWIRVGDDGQGMHAQTERPGLGLGLALIAQLCSEFAIARRPEGGTELRMRFALDPGNGEVARTPDGGFATARAARAVLR